MKRTFFGIALMSLAALFACSEQDQELGVNDNATYSVQFGLDVRDLTTKTGNDDDQYYTQKYNCPEEDELILAAKYERLKARFKITGRDEDGSQEIERTIRYSDEGEFIADPYDLPKREAAWELTSFIVFEDRGSEENILYSAVGSKESEFASFLEDDEILPHDILIDDSNIYDKKTHNITVICAIDRDAEAFGYKMWDLDFINFQKVPFMVNDCGGDNVHSVMSGRLDMYSDKDTTDNMYTKGKLLKTVYFKPNYENKLYIIDNININNDKEFYGYELYKLTDDVDSNGPDANDGYTETPVAIGDANVSYLIGFEENTAAWMYSMLDINLCDPEGTEDWIFTKVDESEDGPSKFALEECNTDTYLEPDEILVIKSIGYNSNEVIASYSINTGNGADPGTHIKVESDEEIFKGYEGQDDCDVVFKVVYKFDGKDDVSYYLDYETIANYRGWKNFDDYLKDKTTPKDTCPNQ